MITSYASFNSDPFSLSEGIKAKLGINEFSNLFNNSIFESSSDNLLLEKAYSTYELGLLYENRKDWFDDNDQIYYIAGEEGQTLLFKNESLFFVSDSTLKMLKEDWSWNDAKAAWDTVKTSAKSSMDSVASASKEAWDTLSDGAKKAWEFAKKITSAAVEFVSKDPLTCAAVFLQLMSGIVAFIPAAGQAAGPVMLGLAGAIEVYVGTTKIKKAWNKFADIDASKKAKAIASFTEGAPFLVAGCSSILLGLNDVMTAPKAALPGVGATSTALRSASTKWSSSFAGHAAHNAEHFIVNVAGKSVSKLGPAFTGAATKFMGSGGSGLAAGALTIMMLKVGKSILGKFFETVLGGLAGISSGVSFVLSLPTKTSGMLEKLIAAAETPVAKILITPLKSIINPVIKFLGKLIDTYLKPLFDGATEYLNTLSKNYKKLMSYADMVKGDGGEPIVTSQTAKTKPKTVEVTKKDLAAINAMKKKAPASTNKVSNTPGKAKESLNHIQVFENFKMP
jgi:hypothetical protein